MSCVLGKNRRWTAAVRFRRPKTRPQAQRQQTQGDQQDLTGVKYHQPFEGRVHEPGGFNNMQARFSLDPLELEFLGTQRDYVLLGSLLRAHSGTVDLIPYSNEARPYLRFAVKAVVMETPDQKTKISIDGETGVIQITGDGRWLDALANNIESFGREAKQADHSHEEYFEGHFYLAADSIPCVLSLRGSRLGS
jgi:hypothetical protein